MQQHPWVFQRLSFFSGALRFPILKFTTLKFDSLVKSLISRFVVIPAKAGIQQIQLLLDTGVRGCVAASFAGMTVVGLFTRLSNLNGSIYSLNILRTSMFFSLS